MIKMPRHAKIPTICQLSRLAISCPFALDFHAQVLQGRPNTSQASGHSSAPTPLRKPEESGAEGLGFCGPMWSDVVHDGMRIQPAILVPKTVHSSAYPDMTWMFNDVYISQCFISQLWLPAFACANVVNVLYLFVCVPGFEAVAPGLQQLGPDHRLHQSIQSFSLTTRNDDHPAM